MKPPLRFILTLICCGLAATAIAQDRCADPGMMTLLVATHVLNFACEELAPETRTEREQVIRDLTAEFPECFAKAQGYLEYFRKQAKATAERIRQAQQPPESTTCLEYAARIRHVREVNGLQEDRKMDK